MPAELATGLRWLRSASLPLTELRESATVRAALDTLALRLDGRPAAATTQRRKRSVLYNVLQYAVELEVLDRRRWTWIRTSSAALELARLGRPVVLSWESVESATIRRRGLFAVLHVALRPDAVAPPTPVQRPRQRRDRRTYTIDVGLLQPGVQSLQTELARHLPQTPA